MIENISTSEITVEMEYIKDVLLDEFHQYWLSNGQPHPNSNAYSNMSRAFFYAKGYERGKKAAENGK
jgi:hypothetical protein